jgi:hypothetical protein
MRTQRLMTPQASKPEPSPIAKGAVLRPDPYASSALAIALESELAIEQSRARSRWSSAGDGKPHTAVDPISGTVIECDFRPRSRSVAQQASLSPNQTSGDNQQCRSAANKSTFPGTGLFRPLMAGFENGSGLL